MSIISVLGNGLVFIVYSLKRPWDNKVKFDFSLVCSSLAIGLFFLPFTSYNLLSTPSPDTSKVVCLVINGIRGFCVLNHMLTACVTSAWNFVSLKYPLQAIGWFRPQRTNLVLSVPWIFGLLYAIGYMLAVMPTELRGGCPGIFKEIPMWIHLLTMYGVIIPSALLILVLNSGFLIVAGRHVQKGNNSSRRTPRLLSQECRWSGQERRASDLHSPDQKWSKLQDQTAFPMNKMPQDFPSDELAIKNRPVCNSRIEKRSEKCVNRSSDHRKIKGGKRLSIFTFVSVIAWLPTIAVSSIVAVCLDCFKLQTLLFISGFSHSVTAITPPVFFALNDRNRVFVRKLCQKRLYQNAVVYETRCMRK